MKLIGAYFKLHMLELVRYPSMLLPGLVLPCLLYLLLGMRDANDPDSAIQVAVGYAAIGVMGVAFFQYGAEITNDRLSPWERYVRTLPVAPLVRFAGRVLAGLVYSALAVMAVFGLAVVLTPARLPAVGWVSLSLALLVASIPFGLLGIALGYWMNPRTAFPIANVLWILLSYAGGLWGEPIAPVRSLMPYLPTRLYVEAILGVSQPFGTAWLPWLGLLAYCVASGVLAVWGYRRDQGLFYR